MDDLISRQEAIDALDKIFPADPMRNDYTQGITCGAALATEYIKQLPSAQPETHDKRTKTHSCDCISRQAAMEEISKQQTYKMFEGEDTLYLDANDVGSVLASLPSAQPEIIRCKDCIFHGLCRTSPKWAVAPKDDWFCADAERRTDGIR